MSYGFDHLNLLVVDDHPHMRKLVRATLQAFGAKTVLEASSGENAWEIMRLNPPDIIFCDWIMCGMSGLEFAKKVRSSLDTPNPCLPIVMLTGHADIKRINQARDAGVNELLVKPVFPRTMLNVLVSALNHPRPFVRTNSYFGPCRRRANTGCEVERRASEIAFRNRANAA